MERITPRSLEKAEDFRWKLLSAVTQITLGNGCGDLT